MAIGGLIHILKILMFHKYMKRNYCGLCYDSLF